jgi:predicted unusual protein kinase regulating ubiquinone biosynthesis (AarF/ABC1/UbiB family)
MAAAMRRARFNGLEEPEASPMNQRMRPPGGSAVPASRIARLARFGGLAGGIAGGVALGAARRLAEGGRPDLGSLLLTPANVARVTRELAHLRGAAMKMGQLLSMDAGDLLPPELAEIMARLRADAEAMPPKQLKATLDRAWGAG